MKRLASRLSFPPPPVLVLQAVDRTVGIPNLDYVPPTSFGFRLKATVPIGLGADRSGNWPLHGLHNLGAGGGR